MASQEDSQRQKAENEALRLLGRITQNVNAHLAPPAADSPEAAAVDLLERCPALHTALFAHHHKGGPPEGASCVFWGSDRGVTLMVNLRFLKARAYFEADSLWDALLAAEKALVDPNFKWQAERVPRAPQGRTKKYTRH